MTDSPREPLAAEQAALIARLAGAGQRANSAEGLCRAIYETIPSHRVTIGRFDRRTGRFRAAYWPPMPKQEERRLIRVFAVHSLQHPRLGAVIRGRRVPPVTTWRLLDPDGHFQRTRLFRTFYAPHGITDQLSFRLPGQGLMSIGGTIDRAGGVFDDAEVAFVERTIDLLADALQSQTAGVGLQVLGAFGWTSIVLADDGEILDSSPRAAALGQRIGLDLTVGATLAGTALWRDLAPRLERPAFVSGDEPDSAMHPGRMPGGRSWLLEIPAIGAARLMLETGDDEDAGSGLTGRQREIAALMAEGLTNKEIAARLGISAGTVRAHLQEIFRRLGVGTRTAAAAAFLRRR